MRQSIVGAAVRIHHFLPLFSQLKEFLAVAVC